MSYRKIETLVNKFFSVSDMARKGKKDMHMTDINPYNAAITGEHPGLQFCTS